MFIMSNDISFEKPGVIAIFFDLSRRAVKASELLLVVAIPTRLLH
jgi:hypothetical protein